MAGSIKVNHKKRGRPATGRDPVSAVRLPAELTASVDKWSEDHETNGSEAIRRLVELGLTIRIKAKQPSPLRAARAKELATKAIEKMIDRQAAPEEQAQRTRRLTKGPLEFREDRVDLPEG